MATIKPFPCIRPDAKVVHRVAALPYDVYDRMEAKAEFLKEPLSFIKIDRPEIQFDDSVDTYDEKVYDKAKETLEAMLEEGIFINDQEAGYYIYELIMDGRSQTGIAACSSIDDYLDNIIKKHENTREEKEMDRIHHVDRTNAHTGPIFLAYRRNQIISNVVAEVKKEQPLYSFKAVDGVCHNVWKINKKEQMDTVYDTFAKMDSIYIADGHHRAASAVKVGLKRRSENKDYIGEEEFNFFLSVLFPDDQLMIMSYNRAVTDLNGLTVNEFTDKVKVDFEMEFLGKKSFLPDEKANFGMYLGGNWYKLTAKESLRRIEDSVKSLDVSLLQDYILRPILNIQDPRTDKRIDFIGGIRGLSELEKRVNENMAVAFSMYPTSIQELFTVADEGKLMPPKSTWFEPKLRSGIFIHKLSDE
ncbi:uncharacterized protein (DUF1015 family) [Mobilisporobacter senegalensis]|uniref:Uncharacterized protein (DUF1015 family) n=1 Tax=Mobilisporobacter senegalensis TaxID=1329262 RepID=A0A3N1XF24_9FIRM|nr:DUF1015 family protein [Mobilisporobacter senegalensis]ROR25319.1 uncharacterized protein (DUF1015 family) [Mobilisporobacter senegalensis]